MGSSTKEYRYVGDYPDSLADGRPVGVGEFVNLGDKEVAEGHNQAMIESGRLIAIEEAEEPDASEAAVKLAKERGVTLAAVTGTGANGQITVEDVKKYTDEAEAAAQQGQEG